MELRRENCIKKIFLQGIAPTRKIIFHRNGKFRLYDLTRPFKSREGIGIPVEELKKNIEFNIEYIELPPAKAYECLMRQTTFKHEIKKTWDIPCAYEVLDMLHKYIYVEE